MKELLAEIVHDIRTPAVSIKMGASGIKDILSKLILTYKEAQKNNLNIPVINDKILIAIENIINNIESESIAINDYLDELTRRSEKSE